MSLINQKGFGLTEALIGLVILSAGLISIYGVHSDFLRSANDSRDRDKAVQLASSRLEEIRDDLSDGKLDTPLITEEKDATGVYTLKTTINEDTDKNLYKVKVDVGWGGLFGSDSILIGAQMKKMKPSSVISVSTNGASTLIPKVSSTIGSPQGEAEYGSGEITETSGVNNEVANDINDGTRIVEEGGLYKLVDNITNEVLLKSSSPLKTISGRMYVNISAAGIEKSDLDTLFVGAPDISVCRNVRITTGSEDNSSYDYWSVGDSSDHYYFYYQCYVGQNWYGDIGILSNDYCSSYNSGTGECQTRVDAVEIADNLACVGDPAETTNDIAFNYFSRYPQSSLKRSYRGYVAATPAENYEIDNANYYVIEGIKNSYEDHHLYFSGTSSCVSSMSDNAISGAFGTSEGRYVCMSGLCPGDLFDLYAKSNTLNVLVSGSIETGLTTNDGITAVSAVVGTTNYECDPSGNKWECLSVPRFGTVSDQVGNDNVNDTWSAGAWIGKILVSYSSGLTCNLGDGSVITQNFVLPSGQNTIAVNCNGSGSGSSCTFSIGWDDGTADVTSTLEWTSSGCSSVTLRRCSPTGQNEFCVPDVNATSVSTDDIGKYVAGGFLGNNKIHCYSLFADSEPASNALCIANDNSDNYRFVEPSGS